MTRLTPESPTPARETGEAAIRPDKQGSWQKPYSPLDVGPVLTLPTMGFLLAGLGAGLAVGLIAWPFVALFRPGTMPSVVWGLIAVWVAQMAGIAALRPWHGRHLGRWPFVWLVGRGVSFAGVLISAALLYSATHPDPLVFGLTTASSYFAVLLSEVAVYARHVRCRTGPPMG